MPAKVRRYLDEVNPEIPDSMHFLLLIIPACPLIIKAYHVTSGRSPLTFFFGP